MRGIKMDAIQELEKMQGTEYVLLHVQEPILYVIRKQKRHSPTATTPLANYYIIAGVVYQAPDLQSIIQSKMLTSIHYLQSAFDECFQYARFHPSTDYYWNFSKDGIGAITAGDDRNSKESKSNNIKEEANKKKDISISEASDHARHMYRVDVLMHELVKKYPPKMNNASTGETHTTGGENTENANPNVSGVKSDNGLEPSTEANAMDTSGGAEDQKSKSGSNQLTPPAKKPKLN